MENILLNYIIGEALIMIPVLWIVGFIIKNTEIVNNKYIPVFLLVASIGFTPILLGGFTAANVVQAILVAGGSVFADQLVKQLVEDK